MVPKPETPQIVVTTDGTEKKVQVGVDDPQKLNTDASLTQPSSESTPDLTKQGQLTSFEDALTKLGGFSWFQIWATCIIILPEIPAAMIAMTPIFVGTNNVHFWVENSSSNFTTFGLQDESIGLGQSLHALDQRLCSVDNNFTISGKIGSPILSIVQEWQLICSRAWLTDLFTSIQMMGMMTGAFTASQLADSFGRKTVFFGAVAMMGVFGVVSGFSSNVFVYGVTKYFAGTGVGGFYVVYVIFLMEFLTPSWRTISGCISIWSVGIILLSWMAYLLPNWRHLTWAASSPALVILGLYPLIPESPRWLLCKGKTMEAHDGFLKISKMNRIKPDSRLSDWETAKLQEIILAENTKNSKIIDDDCEIDQMIQKSSSSLSVMKIFQNSTLRGQLGLFLFGWFSSAFVYYGMSFNTKNLSGNPYLNVLYLGLVDLPAFPSGVLFNNWLGRRKTYAGYWIFATIFLGALVAVDQFSPAAPTPLPSSGAGLNEDEHNQNVTLLVTIFCYLGRFGVAGAWGIVTCFTAESFPTVCRSTALGLGSLFASIGGVLAPQLVFLGTLSPSAPYFIFAGLSLACAVSSIFLRETNEKPLENFVK